MTVRRVSVMRLAVSPPPDCEPKRRSLSGSPKTLLAPSARSTLTVWPGARSPRRTRLPPKTTAAASIFSSESLVTVPRTRSVASSSFASIFGVGSAVSARKPRSTPKLTS